MLKKNIIKSVLLEMFSSRMINEESKEVKTTSKETDTDEENPTKADNWGGEKKEGEQSANFSGLYRRVQNKLKDDRINHAAIMRDLEWEGDDNTNRSLFEKKLKRADNDTGGKYAFTQNELEKILNSIETIGKDQ